MFYRDINFGFEVLLDFQERVSFELLLTDVRDFSTNSIFDHFDGFLVFGQKPVAIKSCVEELFSNFIFHDNVILDFDFTGSDNCLEKLDVSFFA